MWDEEVSENQRQSSAELFLAEKGDIMYEIRVLSFNGIPVNYQQLLYDKMKECTTTERLLVCLYFMSDLRYERNLDQNERYLAQIERNLRLIFSPDLRYGNLPEDYATFPANAIRGLLNGETLKIKEKMRSNEGRYWQNPERGYWRNTPLGNQRAIEILGSLGVVVTKKSKPE